MGAARGWGKGSRSWCLVGEELPLEMGESVDGLWQWLHDEVDGRKATELYTEKWLQW